MANAKRIVDCISAHSWNADQSLVALCPNNSEVHIYRKDGTNYKREHVLTDHDQVVTAIDWAPKTNRIVTCSQDRNAYVWKLENGQWKPTLVILRLNRAATDVRWSPNEDKFAVASGAKVISVCYYEEENDWWVSKIIKKHKSTVNAVTWHPNNIFVASGSSDFKARVFSGFVKGIDSKDSLQGLPEGAAKFGEPLAEYESKGWVHSVAFSPDGKALAFCGHDATVSIVDDVLGSGESRTVLRLPLLPLVNVAFVANDALIGVGHDNTPILVSKKGGSWAFVKKLDEKGLADGGSSGPAKTSAVSSAFAKFQAQATQGSDKKTEKLETVHQNCITNIVPFRASDGKASKFSTSGLDGIICVWDWQTIEQKLAGMSVN